MSAGGLPTRAPLAKRYSGVGSRSSFRARLRLCLATTKVSSAASERLN